MLYPLSYERLESGVYRRIIGLMSLLPLLIAPLLFGPAKVESTILNKPEMQAAKEHKVLFVHFTASWCKWCHRMEGVLGSPTVKPIWDKAFIDVPVVVDESKDKISLETPRGNMLRSQLGGDKQGIPFFAFVDSDGNVLENSFMKPGENMGCPALPPEIDAFMTKLKKATTKLSDSDLQVIRDAFASAK
jgi:hypothetical protein